MKAFPGAGPPRTGWSSPAGIMVDMIDYSASTHASLTVRLYPVPHQLERVPHCFTELLQWAVLPFANAILICFHYVGV